MTRAELEALVIELGQRVDALEELVLVDEPERPATLGDARAALLARAKERRTR